MIHVLKQVSNSNPKNNEKINQKTMDRTKLTAEEILRKKWVEIKGGMPVPEIESLMEQVTIEAMEEHTQNQVNTYKEELRKEIEAELTKCTNTSLDIDNPQSVYNDGWNECSKWILSLLDKPQDSKPW